MAKRFSDTEKWKKPFIRRLEAPYKLLWIYILDECDHAGIWQVDFQIAEIKIGEKLDMQKALVQFGNKIHVFDSGEKWFVPGFIDFQYGGLLNPSNRVHSSVLTILEKYNLRGAIEGKLHTSPLHGAKDKDKDKDKNKDMDMDMVLDKVKDSNNQNDTQQVATKNTQKTSRLMLLTDFSNTEYVFDLSNPVKVQMDKFLKYRFERGEPISQGQTIEAMLSSMWRVSKKDDDLIYMINNTMACSAKNIITELKGKDNGGNGIEELDENGYPPPF